jgi:hypothetical protein
MGYCDGNCEYLERDKRHTCAKYGKRLGYIKRSGSLSYEAHEQCDMCQKDKWIHKLEGKLKCDFVQKGCMDKDCSKCDYGKKGE